jgi:hypothetical protein
MCTETGGTERSRQLLQLHKITQAAAQQQHGNTTPITFKELRQICDISRGYKCSTGPTGVQKSIGTQQGLQVLKRVYRRPTIHRNSTGPTGIQQSTGTLYGLQTLNRTDRLPTIYRNSIGSTGAQQTLQASSNLRELNRVYRCSTGLTGIQQSTGTQQGLKEPNRVHRHSTVYRSSTGSTGTQKCTGAQQNLQALNTFLCFHVKEGVTCVYNAVLFVLQFRTFTWNAILFLYFRTTKTFSKERQVSYECQIPLESFFAHIIVEGFCSNTRGHACEFSRQMAAEVILRGK